MEPSANTPELLHMTLLGIPCYCQSPWRVTWASTKKPWNVLEAPYLTGDWGGGRPGPWEILTVKYSCFGGTIFFILWSSSCPSVKRHGAADSPARVCRQVSRETVWDPPSPPSGIFPGQSPQCLVSYETMMGLLGHRYGINLSPHSWGCY